MSSRVERQIHNLYKVPGPGAVGLERSGVSSMCSLPGRADGWALRFVLRWADEREQEHTRRKLHSRKMEFVMQRVRDPFIDKVAYKQRMTHMGRPRFLGRKDSVKALNKGLPGRFKVGWLEGSQGAQTVVCTCAFVCELCGSRRTWHEMTFWDGKGAV